MKITSLLNIILLSCLFLTSCNDEDPSKKFVYTDVALIESVTQSGTTFRVADKSSDVSSLHSETVLKDEETELTGKCIVIQYTIADKKTGSISLLSASMISNFNAFISTEEDITGWDTDAVHLQSCWSIDRHVVMRAALPYYPENRKVAIIVDELTKNEAFPTAYLYHSLEGAIDTADTFYRTYYIAFDTTAIPESATWQGLKIHFNDLETKNNTITIEF